MQLVSRVLCHAARVRGPSQTATLPCTSSPYGSSFKNKAARLIENGVAYDTNRLHRKKYFSALIKTSEIPEELKRLLGFNRMQIEMLQRIDRAIISSLRSDPLLADRVARLRTIDGVGEITALTWALETGEPSRFPNAKHALSYCGLCSPQRELAGVGKRGPLSKQRNRFLQTTLIEAAHLAPRYNEAARTGTPVDL